MSWAQKHSGTKREVPSAALAWGEQWGSQEEEEDYATMPLVWSANVLLLAGRSPSLEVGVKVETPLHPSLEAGPGPKV